MPPGLLRSAAIPVQEVLELGSGGGHNAVHLRASRWTRTWSPTAIPLAGPNRGRAPAASWRLRCALAMSARGPRRRRSAGGRGGRVATVSGLPPGVRPTIRLVPVNNGEKDRLRVAAERLDEAAVVGLAAVPAEPPAEDRHR